MSIGSKIKFFRQQKRMTQQELGEAIGFSKPSAGVRIAQYESGVRTPKDFTLEEIANALLVSPEALKAPEIKSVGDLMQVLFLLEDMFGVKLTRDESSMTASIEIHADRVSPLYCKLFCWNIMRGRLANDDIGKDSYNLWRFGLS